ncbi:MAG TPA: hypothetical protein VN673_09895 [Clostridia bacterium]|nr:hypothetical protein [Clostridia bacterium]
MRISVTKERSKSVAGGDPAERAGWPPRPLWGERAYSVVEVVIAVFLLGTLTVALFGAFSTGLSAVQASRENMRATQILMQKMEAIRLFTWQQSTNRTLAATNFTDWYDPLGTNSNGGGVLYRGVVTVGPAPASIPADLRSDLRLVTVTLHWTNHIGHSAGILQKREMETLIAREGLQNYIF